MARHFAFFSFPGFGHVKPALPVVDELVKRGHRVTHFVARRLAGVAARPGVRVVPYDSEFPEPFGPAADVDEAAGMLVALLDEGLAPLSAAREVLDGDRPDVLVHDDISAHTARLLGAQWQLPLARLYAHFAPYPRTGDPTPAEASGQAGDGIDPVAVMAHPALAAAWLEAFERLAPLGFTMESAIEALQVEDVAVNLVFLPRRFQPGEGFPGRFAFVGPTPEPSPVHWDPPGDKQVALVSLGTSREPDPSFFRRCAEAFAGSDWHVVMTLGAKLTPAEVGDVPANVELHQWLPHGAVLPHARAYVGATGMNSVMEALAHNTPVIAVPRSDEQRATARRIGELGLGQWMEPDAVSPRAVFDAVRAVAANPSVARRVGEMSELIEGAGGAARAADELEACG